MYNSVIQRKCLFLINCVNNLLNIRLRSKYDFVLFCYLNYSLCFKYFLFLYRKFYWQSRIAITENMLYELNSKELLYYCGVQYDLLSIFYEKFNFFSIFYNIRRKRKQRRSLFLVLAFDKHVCFKNIEQEYEQIKSCYAKWL